MQPCVATPSHQSILSPAEAKNVPIFFAVMRLMQSKVTRPIKLGSKNWVHGWRIFFVCFQFLIHFTQRKFFEWCHDAALAQWSALSTWFQEAWVRTQFCRAGLNEWWFTNRLVLHDGAGISSYWLQKSCWRNLSTDKVCQFFTHYSGQGRTPFFLTKATP